MLSEKNVLITGGYGFIGSNLVRHIVEKKLAKGIFVLDRLSENPEKIQRLKDIANKTKTINIDIRNISSIENELKDIDIIFHQAAFVSVPESIKRPSETIETNVLGTVKLLDLCRKNDIERFVLASSAAVYGEQNIPLKENENLNPVSPYGLSKLMAEDYCRIYSKLYGLNTVCLRYFNVYGPGQTTRGKAAGIISILHQHFTENKPFVIFGDGENTRDYIHVSDVVDANILASYSNLVNGEAVNIATGRPLSINNLLEIAKNAAKRELMISRVEPREGDVLHSYADASLAKETLNFEAKIPIEEGIKNTFNLLPKGNKSI